MKVEVKDENIQTWANDAINKLDEVLKKNKEVKVESESVKEVKN